MAQFLLTQFGKVFKKTIKKIFLRIYEIGLQEFNLKANEEIKLNLKKRAIVPDTVVFNEKTKIVNQTGFENNIEIGKYSIILGELLTFQHGGKIVVGEFVFIGENSRIWSSCSIKIGNRVLISHNVNIHDNISHSLESSIRHEEFLYSYYNHKPMPNDNLLAKQIVIGDDVWIGFNVTILKGVHIGNRAIIGANAIIVKDVPEGAVVVGFDQRIIKYAD